MYFKCTYIVVILKNARVLFFNSNKEQYVSQSFRYFVNTLLKQKLSSLTILYARIRIAKFRHVNSETTDLVYTQVNLSVTLFTFLLLVIFK